MTNNENVTVRMKTINESLQDIRYKLSKTELKKSGKNKHLNFDYFELKDFLPTATKLFNDEGICPQFSIVTDQNGIEVAVLNLVRGAESIKFVIPTDQPANMSGIQALGAKITYLRRYLYLIALDIVENDIVDASIESNEAPKEEKKATAKQVSMIKDLYDEENQKKILDYYKIETLEDLNLAEASKVIANKRDKK